MCLSLRECRDRPAVTNSVATISLRPFVDRNVSLSVIISDGTIRIRNVDWRSKSDVSGI